MPRDAIHDLPEGLDQLLAIMRRLRDPQTGCPWDVEQTYATIAPYTIEEAYEVADAIERGAMTELRSELGDLLFQVVFHSQMADEEGHFSFHDVTRDVARKMIDRHPHVFGDESRDKSAEQQTRDWETVKAAERAAKGATGVLDDVAVGLPALLRALKLQKRAARVGFDWPSTDEVLAKITEEAAELVEARDTLGPDEVEEEMGVRGVPLTALFEFYHKDEHNRVWGAAFSCVYDGEIVLQEEEVESGSFMAIAEILRLAETEPFTPDGLYVLKRYIAEHQQKSKEDEVKQE